MWLRIILPLVFAGQLFSQNNSRIFSLNVMGGAQFLQSKNKQKEHEIQKIDYLWPGLMVSSDLALYRRNRNHPTLGIRLISRQGIYDTYRGGLGGGSYSKGEFSLIRGNVQFGYHFKFKSNDALSFGTGLYYGFVAFISGKSEAGGHDISGNYIIPTSPRSAVSGNQAGICLELRVNIPQPGNRVPTISIFAMFESSEFEQTPANQLFGIAIGFTFSKEINKEKRAIH